VVARVAKAASGPVTDALEPLHEALAMAPAAGKVCSINAIVPFRCTQHNECDQVDGKLTWHPGTVVLLMTAAALHY
jgi:hypothetical protein